MLTEKDIKEIEKAIGVEDLAGKWTSEEVQELEFTKTKHFSESEHRQLITNVSNDVPKEKWDEAKKTGIEMAVKDLKKEKGFDFEGKSIEALTTYFESQLEKNKTSNDSELKSKYESDIEELRKAIKDYKGKLEENQLKSKTEKINSTIDSYFNTLNIITLI
jgi:uncharacterized protein (DUF885 family)